MDSAIIFCAKYLVLIVVLLFALAWFKNSKRKMEMAGALIIAGIIAVVLTKIGGWVYYDPRPFVSGHVKPLIAHSADNGFPSDHTVFAMTISAVIYFYNKKIAALAFAATLAVGLARVLAHIHSPIDILGGLLIGVLAAASGYKIAELLSNKTQSSHAGKADQISAKE